MRRKKLWISLMVATLLAILLVACNKQAVSKINFIFKPDQGDGVVAEVQGEKIKEDMLFVGMEKVEIHQKEMEIYEMRMNKLNSVLLEKLLDKEPDKKGLSNKDFVEKHIVAKVAKPTQKEIDAFVKERNIPEEQVGQLKDKIIEFLAAEKQRKALNDWMAQKTKGMPVTVYMQKPEPLTFNVDIGKVPVMGPENAPITIIEYTDFQCPYCAKAHDSIEKIKKDFAGKIRFAVKHYPLPFHHDGKRAAEASLCANDQGDKYTWKMNDIMFKNQQSLTMDGLVKLASDIGLNKEKFEDCLKKNKYLSLVEEDIQQGQNLRLNSVPAFFINGKLLHGAQPYEAFAELVKEELKQKKL